MIITTTNNIEGKTIEKYIDMVHGECIIGTNVFKDLFASITEVLGGRNSAYEKVLREAKEVAMEELRSKAREMGANAVIGIDLDFEKIGEGILMVSANGTAVSYK